MKLFQIEEPDGGPSEPEGAGVAVGMDVAPDRGGAVAVAVGGNAETLPGRDGERRLGAPALLRPDGSFDEGVLHKLLLGLRERAEKQLARPATHAVIAARLLDARARAALTAAAEAAGLAVLRLLDRDEAAALAQGAPADEAAAHGAAIQAEDDARSLSLPPR